MKDILRLSFFIAIATLLLNSGWVSYSAEKKECGGKAVTIDEATFLKAHGIAEENYSIWLKEHSVWRRKYSEELKNYSFIPKQNDTGGK